MMFAQWTGRQGPSRSHLYDGLSLACGVRVSEAPWARVPRVTLTPTPLRAVCRRCCP